LLWAALYIGAGAAQGQRAEHAAAQLARDRGHVPERLTVKPSFGNLLVWKSIYAADGDYHVDAIRAGWGLAVVPGESIPQLDPARDLPWLDPDSRQARDLERFGRFSRHYLALDPGNGSRVVDIRYSMVPNEIDALWGILLDPAAAPDQPAAFVTSRRATPEHRAALWRLLMGRRGQSQTGSDPA